jgi:hypothetical protein
LLTVPIASVALGLGPSAWQPAPLPQKATEVQLAPRVVASIDLGKMEGALIRQLAWSADGNELYLQTYDADRTALPKAIFHYVIPAEGGTPKQVAAIPEWAQGYLAWKSAQTAPGDPTFKIELQEEKGISAATAMPMAGDMAKGGTSGGGPTGVSSETVMEMARQSQNTITRRFRLKGETIGEWVNHPIIPGLTFGWGPERSGLVAFAEKKGGALIVMDKSGAKRKVEGTKNVAAPSWSTDGSRLAYLEGSSKTRFSLVVATVTK